MVSVCLLFDAFFQYLLSYLGFSYLGCGISPHGCSSKAQPLLLTLDEGYLFTAAPLDLERGIAPLGPLVPTQPLLLGRGVAPPGHHPWPPAWGSSSCPPRLASGRGSTSWLRLVRQSQPPMPSALKESFFSLPSNCFFKGIILNIKTFCTSVLFTFYLLLFLFIKEIFSGVLFQKAQGIFFISFDGSFWKRAKT